MNNSTGYSTTVLQYYSTTAGRAPHRVEAEQLGVELDGAERAACNDHRLEPLQHRLRPQTASKPHVPVDPLGQHVYPQTTGPVTRAAVVMAAGRQSPLGNIKTPRLSEGIKTRRLPEMYLTRPGRNNRNNKAVAKRAHACCGHGRGAVL
eukprot:7730738-Pyramimonas_sp.AAC.1